MLNLTLSACYMHRGGHRLLCRPESARQRIGTCWGFTLDNPAEPLLLRLVLLLLMTLFCYAAGAPGAPAAREEEAREFAVREGQLRSAGRLAAEIAHQIKNPLAIINNAAFSLQRALQEGKGRSREQIRNHPGGGRTCGPDHHPDDGLCAAERRTRREARRGRGTGSCHRAGCFPRRPNIPHQVRSVLRAGLPAAADAAAACFGSVLVNVLQNAREALSAIGGKCLVQARCRRDQSIEVCIRDDGPGIPPEKLDEYLKPITRPRKRARAWASPPSSTTSSSMAGTVRVESELGKGARLFYYSRLRRR